MTRARELLANDEPERARYVTGQARELWRGEPLVDLADWGPGRVEAERLVELWRDADDLPSAVPLHRGRPSHVIPSDRGVTLPQPTCPVSTARPALAHTASPAAPQGLAPLRLQPTFSAAAHCWATNPSSLANERTDDATHTQVPGLPPDTGAGHRHCE
ncbi:BTAD domain-containing putative transcriptional regulator [Phycicoccus sp. Soil802]|uniref:BTAD domain-containing putative transcriptional regulator n=1 Tax=Phycicoccus sp. Soil802 TaxID=1736414 RepID=UPI0035285424